MATTYLQRTSGGSPTSNTKMTISLWLKRGKLDNAERFINSNNVSDPYFQMYFGDSGNTEDAIRLQHYNGGSECELITNRKFRDTNGYYHICYSYDSTPSSPSSSSVKLWINGVQETSFAVATYPSQNDSHRMNTGNFQIGGYNSGSFFTGIISHFYYIDGTAYDADTFGSVDSTSGIWKINTSPTVTMGTNGFTILKDGNTITDQSSNSNNFTLAGGTLTNTEDCPSDVFATMNNVATTHNIGNTITFSNGNLVATNSGGGAWQPIMSTLGASKGKYYAEFKCVTIGGASKYGILDVSQYNSQVNWVTATRGYGYEYNEGAATAGASLWDTTYGDAFTTGDIISVAMDLDNMKLYFAKNGVWQNSGNPESGATGTGTHTYFGGSGDTANATGVDTYAFAMNIHNSSVTHANFGNGYFGTTAVSSAGTNASNIGIFEYDVPTGYTALSTKGLNA